MDTATDAAADTETEVPTRGRPREFDEDAVLDALVQLFWEHSYEATSVTDIVHATGLSKSSLYNAFGSKEELFERALNRYVDFRTSIFTELLSNGSRGLDDIAMLFDALWDEVASGGDHRGCLAVNTSSELGQRDDRVVAVGRRYRASIRAALQAAFNRAAHLGEIDPAQTEKYANLMLSFIIGTAVIVRSGADDTEVLEHLDAARAILDGWRTT